MKYFLYALCLSLIILKLTNFIDWSWWLVTLPIYGGAVLWSLVFAFVVWAEVKIENKRKPQIRTKSRFQERLDNYMEQQRQNQIRDKLSK